MDDREIRALFQTHDVALGAKDVWAVQGTPVIKHAALERLAAKLEVVWDAPVVIRAERDEAVVMVRAARKDGIAEWSFGEALIGANYRVSGKQASYVWAMAEKRAKDRVIIKLAGLHGAYSDEEADEFKTAPRDTAGAGNDDAPDSKALFIQGAQATIRQATDKAALATWWKSEAQRQQRRAFGLNADENAILVRLVTERGEALDAAAGEAAA